MKRTLFCAVLLLAAPAVQAQTAIGVGQSNASSGSIANSFSNSGLTINNPGVTQNLNRVRQSGSLRTTANAFAPQLVASAVNSCLGSASLGLGLTGIGISGGSTYPDRPCNLRMFSALLLSMGQKNAAAAVLCKDPDVYAAFASVGVACPLIPDGYRVVAQEPVYVAPTMPPGRPTVARRGIPVETDYVPVFVGEAPQRPSQGLAAPCYGGGEKHCSY